MTAPLDALAKHFAGAPEAPRVILDIGAADGADTVRYAEQFPSARILAFEPLPYNVEELRQVLGSHRLLDRVTIHQVALSDSDGETDFWVSGGEPPEKLARLVGTPPGPRGWRYSSSTLEPLDHLRAFPWCTFERESVKTQRLDTLAADEGIDRIDFAHVDVQGAELAVLRGMGALLGTTGAIWLEVSNRELYRGQPLRADVEDFMSNAGFKLAVDASRGGAQGDQLWVRS
jgi:FkbM family methyltransferase